MAGRIQNEDIKSLAEITANGGSKDQLPNDTKLFVTAFGRNLTLDEVLKQNKLDNSPLQLHANSPIPDSKLYINASVVDTLNGVGKNAPVINGVTPNVPASTIDFQTQVTTGATFTLTFPVSTVGKFRRLALSLLDTGVIQGVFSAESVTVGGLADIGSLSIPGSYLIGSIDLECTNASPAYFKTAGSSTNVIENYVGGFTILNINSLTAPTEVTASSIGAGSQVYKQKVGSNLEIRSITAGNRTGVTQNANDISVAYVEPNYTAGEYAEIVQLNSFSLANGSNNQLHGEIIIFKPGVVRLLCTFIPNDNNPLGNMAFYKNGVQITSFYSGGSYGQGVFDIAHDMTVAAGDRVQVWGYSSHGSISAIGAYFRVLVGQTTKSNNAVLIDGIAVNSYPRINI